MKKGYSVIEILVVVGVFAILGILATQSISLSLRSSKKSGSIIDVKQELDNAAGNIERSLQTASSVVVENCSAGGYATSSVGFRNSRGARGDIACLDFTPGFFVADHDKRVASSSGETVNFVHRITSSKVDLSACGFTCYTENNRTYIDFLISGSAAGVSSSEGASVTTSRKILVRGVSRR